MADLLSYALTTVADVKETLGLDAGDSSKNNLIIRKINQATEMIEKYTGRRFKSTVYTDEEYDASRTDQLVLRQRPVTAIASISQRETSQNQPDWETVDDDFYFVDSNSGVVSSIFLYSGNYNRYKATYTAGYTTIPADIAEACATLAAYMVQNGVAGTGVKARTEGQRKIEYFDNSLGNTKSLIEQLSLDDILNAYTNYPL